MTSELDRRALLKLLGLGGVVLGSGLPGFKLVSAAGGSPDFFFLQLSDTHWGFSGPPNPQADQTLREAVRAVNASSARPDFVVFTGDLTHTTDDDAVRRKRMAEFKSIVADLKVRIICTGAASGGPCAAATGASAGTGSSTGSGSGDTSGGSTGGTTTPTTPSTPTKPVKKKSTYYTVTVSIDGTTIKDFNAHVLVKGVKRVIR